MRREEEPSLRDFLLYLEAVAGLYPGGIPEDSIQNGLAELEEGYSQQLGQVVHWGSQVATVAFLMTAEAAPVETSRPRLFGAAGELLRAAIEKGMRLSIFEVGFIRCFSEQVVDDQTRQGWRSTVEQVFDSSPSKVIVALGDGSWELLVDQDMRGKICRGSWFDFRSALVMPTHSLETVISSADAKREFWCDLQQVMAKLSDY